MQGAKFFLPPDALEKSSDNSGQEKVNIWPLAIDFSVSIIKTKTLFIPPRLTDRQDFNKFQLKKITIFHQISYGERIIVQD